MELQLGLALPGNPTNMLELDPSFSSNRIVSDSNYRKRTFDGAFHKEMPRTLQLLDWNDSSNKDDDDDAPKDTEETSCVTNNNDDGDGGSLVGWPPIKCWKKKKLTRNNHGIEVEEINPITQETNGSDSFNGRLHSNSMYVKVKLEGVGIARKIDLSLHRSYQTLTDALLSMFDICDENSRNYMLAYQDKEGDWLLVDDEHVPWRTFVGSVQRLKLVRRE
ncbi:auxin-responsive protein IAA29-like isoform X2 [Tripterygium wilfordii]|uniref:auxin-responsive protein IAA29-like isoform X2 n=1 Tax=Tripterygium wilfordii TaxID=458696 RepID=UPI0018F82B3F|nr:auxin-responsive protein IAA29-like isoform X2 [Tripterygium wilfordii]